MTSIAFPDSSSLVSIPSNSISVTCTAPVNIAVIKYWGKRDEQLILPINSSLSATIDQGSMKANTLIIASKTFSSHTLTLNHKREKINNRLTAVITALLQLAEDIVDDAGNVLIKKEEWDQYHLQIISVNNFPTAAGLASSAAGLACFTRCLAELYSVKESFPGELTTIARLGSGSACRSLYGGWVRWSMGTSADGSDSIAEQVVDEYHWPEIRVLILVANQAQKETSSTEGMQRSVETSALLSYRASHIVAQRMQQMETALKHRDFSTFAELTMKDSNQFHACCADTYPPIFYLNESSQHIIHIITQVNALHTSPIAAYTFDAGPNAVIYTLETHMQPLIELFKHYYEPIEPSSVTTLHQPNGHESEFVYDPMRLSNNNKAASSSPAAVNPDWFTKCGARHPRTKVHQIIVSKVGAGAQITGKLHTFPAAAAAAHNIQ